MTLIEAQRRLDAARPQMDTSSAVTDEILKERLRQVNEEGCTPEDDDLLTLGELASAAASYAYYAAAVRDQNEKGFVGKPPTMWPWHAQWWKPSTRRRELVKAAALIVAEIERLDRFTAKQP